MSRSMSPAGKDDKIRTPQELASAIVKHFGPTGRILDPCAGGGAFYDSMTEYTGTINWCEIDRGRDFLECENNSIAWFNAMDSKFDWIVTNPPWGKQFRPILNKAMECSENIVFLCNLNVWFTKCWLREVKEAGFGMCEVLMVPTPPKPWPQTGFALGAMWLRRGWTGSLTMSYLKDSSK